MTYIGVNTKQTIVLSSYLHDFALHILCDLVLGIISIENQKQAGTIPLRQTIVKDRIVCSQHNNEVEPSLREPVHRVVFNDHTSISHDGLQVVENLQKQA